MFMKMSKKLKINDDEIYCDLLLMIADVEDINTIDITETSDIPTALDRLRIGIKYKVFDLEATRREWEHLKGLLDDKES